MIKMVWWCCCCCCCCCLGWGCWGFSCCWWRRW